MALQYLAGQRLTADALQRAVPDRVTQGSDQTVTSSVALVNSGIVITVDGLMKIDLVVRFTAGSAGGGIRSDWIDTGSVTVLSRASGTAGAAATGGTGDLTEMRWIAQTSFANDLTIAASNAQTLNRISETLIADGSGTLTFRFAQNTSNAANTTIFADSYALITRLGS